MGISRKLSSNLLFICGNWSYSLRWVLTHNWKVSYYCDCSWHRTFIQFKSSLSNIVYLIEKDTENCREPESWSTWSFLLKVCFSHFPRKFDFHECTKERKHEGGNTVQKKSWLGYQWKPPVHYYKWGPLFWEVLSKNSAWRRHSEFYYTLFYHHAPVGLCCAIILCPQRTIQNQDMLLFAAVLAKRT